MSRLSCASRRDKTLLSSAPQYAWRQRLQGEGPVPVMCDLKKEWCMSVNDESMANFGWACLGRRHLAWYARTVCYAWLLLCMVV
ncbi:hypothetical protein M0804_015569 [Polistes exclamans]|nr:hypothetical protein M0804_015569 [Polistes exclamans]